MKLRWLLLFVFCAFPLTSGAEVFAENSGITNDWYVGVTYSGLKYKEESADFHQPATTLRLGYEFVNYFGIETHVGVGLHDDEIGGISYGVDYLAGIYLRGSIFLWDPRARFYVLAGATRGKVAAENAGLGLSDSFTGTEPGFGLGIEFYGDPRNAVNLEYMRYMDGEENGVNYDITAVSVGYIHRF